MITDDERRLLGELAKLAHGTALRRLLNEELEHLKDVSNCESWEDALGRKHAIKVLRKIFLFLEDREKKPASKSQYT